MEIMHLLATTAPWSRPTTLRPKYVPLQGGLWTTAFTNISVCVIFSCAKFPLRNRKRV